MTAWVKHYINNLKLKSKILIISLLSTLLVGVTALISISFVMHSNNKVLYKSIADSMTYASAEIESTLNNIKMLSGLIITDTQLQEQMDSLPQLKSPIEINEGYEHLKKILLSYYNQYGSNYIDSIQLNMPHRTIKTYQNHLNSAPEAIMTPILQKAEPLRGGALWVTDYTSQYGLILSRSVRKLQNLDLSPMGGLSIFIDLDSLMKHATNSKEQTPENYYFLFNEKQLLYKPDEFTLENAQDIHHASSNLYQIITIDSKQYFAVKNTLEINGSNIRYQWDYLCLAPYSEMHQSIVKVYVTWGVFIVLAIICAVILSNILIRNITKHFDILIHKMDTFRDANMEVGQVPYDYKTRGDELGVIHRTFDNMASEIKNLIEVNYVSELLKKEAQLKALENQINPHFLYNTLESVNWRAKAIGEPEISSMMEALGTMLRITLEKKEEHFTLRQELELVKSYMTIQQIRFEERLLYQVSVEERLLNASIPRLTIQPLVENAISYALEQMTDQCSIQVLVEEYQGVLSIYVRNNGSLFESNTLEKLHSNQISPHGFGIGLLNINHRLQLTFGESYGLTLYNQDDWAIARITIPYLE